ncbi:MAG TPA: ribonuclease P protein subunit [Thermoplasmatales archaeon]|nr:ribonuclease P protein subunit [Thermoplasmatales archaeon]
MDEETLLIKGELIGQKVTVVASTDPQWVNKSGVIVDETKNTFTLEIKGEEKVIAKEIATFAFVKDGKKYEIEGSRLRYRPEDRIKKAR